MTFLFDAKLDEFFGEFEPLAAQFQWELRTYNVDQIGFIRAGLIRTTDDRCPMTVFLPLRAVDTTVIASIIQAADNTQYQNHEIRVRLLRATRLA